MRADPMLRFATAKEWNAWLERHHEVPDGLWLELAKKGAAFTTVTYAEALEVALCWGWIDGQKGAIDESTWKQRFTPRRARSIWSKVNREKAEGLIRDGRMRPRGLAEVERAKGDGRWAAAYDSPKQATVPDDLKLALEASKPARALFERLDATNRFAILHRVATAKQAATRARRIATFVAMLAKGDVPYPDRLPSTKKPRK